MKTDEHFDRAVLRTVLQASSDEGNPDGELLYDLVRRTETIAVVGMSRNPEKAARRVPSYLRAKGAEIIPVNPAGGRIFGRNFVPSLDDVTEPVDMVIIFRPSDQAGPFVEQAAARPEKPIVWLQSGIRADDEAAAARANGVHVVQDLCIYEVHRALGDTVKRIQSRGGPLL